jgi:hypothetical protein
MGGMLLASDGVYTHTSVTICKQEHVAVTIKAVKYLGGDALLIGLMFTVFFFSRRAETETHNQEKILK